MNDEYQICRNVFLGGADAPSKELFTRLWAQLISDMEEEKDVVASSP
ncbi:MAG: hypothetical protein LUD69_08065 [Oscillospiraceae bacterium]|nr:hypothetical protein [Oscillospiraceae bacterium]